MSAFMKVKTNAKVLHILNQSWNKLLEIHRGNLNRHKQYF